MIEITPSIQIDENALQFAFIRAAGPGGQNVNKVSTAVQLRFDIAASGLPEEIQTRLIRIAGKRVTQEGILMIEAKRFRTQEQNKEAALQRLVEWVRKASEKPKPRTKTKPTKASKQARLDSKRKRGEIKRTRQTKVYD